MKFPVTTCTLVAHGLFEHIQIKTFDILWRERYVSYVFTLLFLTKNQLLMLNKCLKSYC